MGTNSRRLTDEQLLSASLLIEDPMAVDRLCRDRPDQELEPAIVGEYHLPTSDPAVWCCHCQGHRHWNGFVVENSTEYRYLIGSHCGPKHYELNFAQAKNRHSDLVHRKGALERIDRLVAIADTTHAACAANLHSEGLALIDRKRAELGRASSLALSLLSSSVQTDTPLSEMVSVRDLDAERRRDEGLPAGQSGPPIYTQQSRSLGMITGAGLVRRRDCRDHLLALQAALRETVQLRRVSTEEVATSALVKAARSAEERWAEAEAAITEAEAAPMFFVRDNLARLERWAASHRNLDIRSDGSDLIVESQRIPPLDAIHLDRLPQLA